MMETKMSGQTVQGCILSSEHQTKQWFPPSSLFKVALQESIG